MMMWKSGQTIAPWGAVSSKTPLSRGVALVLLAATACLVPRMLHAEPLAATVLRQAYMNLPMDLRGPTDSEAPLPMGASARPSARQTIDVSLFPDANLTLVQDRVESPDGQMLVWYGHVDGATESEVTLVERDGVLTGNIRWDDRHVQIRYAGDGQYTVEEIDPHSFPACQDEAHAPDAGPLNESTALSPDLNAPLDSGDVIDVMVLYTPAARQAAGNTSAIEGVVNLAIAETNTGMSNSQVTPRVRLVHMEEIAYNEGSGSTAFTTTLSQLSANGDGFIDQIHAMRDTYGADNVVMIIHDSSFTYCGLGYLMTSPSNGFSAYAFSVTAWNCATGNYSFGHELGHNWGAHHDRANAGGSGSYNYSYGYQQVSAPQRSIMAYYSGCTCPRLNYWSNPDASVNGYPMGVEYTAANSADNRLTINNNAAIIANWRSAPTASGVTLSSDVSSGQPEGTTVTWTAAGQGGSGGYEYEFSLQGPGTGGVLTVQQAYSTIPTWEWTATGVGDNTVRARVRTTGSAVVEAASTTAAFTVTANPTASATVSPSPASARPANTLVTWTAQGQGGSGAYEYQFWHKGPATGDTWTIMQRYGGPTWVWQTGPADVGANSVIVWVRNAGSTANFETFVSGLYAVTAPMAAGVTLTSNVVDPQNAGTTVSWASQGQGGSGTYEYQFWQKGPYTGDTWTIAQAYGGGSTWNWKTAVADSGITNVSVWVRNAGSAAYYEASSHALYSVTPPAATSVTLSPDLPSAQAAGTPITWTAQAAGGSGAYEYQFWHRGPANGNTWTVAQPYGGGNAWTWQSTIADSGANAVVVYARSVGSAARFDTYIGAFYTLTLPPATGVSILPNILKATDRTSVIVLAVGEGGTGSYEFEFSLQGPQTGNVMQVQQPYSTADRWTWDTSGANGANTILVRVRNAGSSASAEASASLAYRVFAPNRKR